MAELVGKQVHVSSNGFKDLKVPIPARNYTAIVIAYAPVLPYLVPSYVAPVNKMVLSLDKPGESHTYEFKFDSETVPVNIGRYVEYPAPFFTKEAEPGVIFDTFEWPFAAPYMARVAVKLRLIGDEVAVENVTETKKIYYKKHGVEDDEFIEIVQNEVVYVEPGDRVFLCDVKREHKDKYADYSFTVRRSEVMERKYVVPMTRVANYAVIITSSRRMGRARTCRVVSPPMCSAPTPCSTGRARGLQGRTGSRWTASWSSLASLSLR